MESLFLMVPQAVWASLLLLVDEPLNGMEQERSSPLIAKTKLLS